MYESRSTEGMHDRQLLELVRELRLSPHVTHIPMWAFDRIIDWREPVDPGLIASQVRRALAKEKSNDILPSR